MNYYFSATGFLGLFLVAAISSFIPNTQPGILMAQAQGYAQAASVPICLDRADIPKEEMHWLYMPNDPTELATSESYGYLSGQLISSGAVDASDCPLNGLWPSGYANACGLERTRAASFYLQNVFDDEILSAGRRFGVPPVMLKQLIRYESQFWPGQMGVYHFGLGHLTFSGALTGVNWSRQLYSDMLGRVLFEGDLPPRDLLANELLSNMNANCPTCPLKVNVEKAEESIDLVADVLLAYCKQTTQVVFNATKKSVGDVVDYATIWRLTLVNYNVGPMCVYSGIQASYDSGDVEAGDRVGWDVISESIESDYCSRGVDYAEMITAQYYDFK